MFVPLMKSSTTFTAINASNCGSQGRCNVAYNIYESSFSLLGGTSAKLSWSSPSPVYFFAVTCTKAVTSAELQSGNGSQASQDCGTNTTVANGTGTSGSYSFSIPSGGSLVFFSFSQNSQQPTVSATLTTTSPLIGIVLLALGLLLAIVGAALKSKKPKQVPGAQAPGQPYPPAQPGFPPPQ